MRGFQELLQRSHSGLSGFSGSSTASPSRRITRGYSAEREELRISGDFDGGGFNPEVAEKRTAAEVASWYGGMNEAGGFHNAVHPSTSPTVGDNNNWAGENAKESRRYDGAQTTQPAVPVLSLFDTLCPELVVPRGSECTLLVPRLEHRTNRGQLMVDDPSGEHVFRAVLVNAPPPTEVSKRGVEVQYLMLGNSEGRGVFGRLSLRIKALQPLTMYDREDNRYGMLEYVGDDGSGRSYILTTAATGRKVYLSTDHHHRTFEAKNDQGKLLAVVDEDEHGGDARDARLRDRRRLVIGPTMDGGLLALCLLGVDWLRELDPRTQWRREL